MFNRLRDVGGGALLDVSDHELDIDTPAKHGPGSRDDRGWEAGVEEGPSVGGSPEVLRPLNRAALDG